MAKLKKYDLWGKETGEVDVGDAFAGLEAHSQMVKDYIVAMRANARQWSACTKSRGEVSHSGQKPHKQKGTGKARQGSLAAAQYKGGGVVFGPRPKFDQHVRINRRERRKAIRYLFGEKVGSGQVSVLSEAQFEVPSTKKLAAALKGMGVKGRVLVLAEGSYLETETEGKAHRVSAPSAHQNLRKSVRNLPRVEFSLAPNANGYDLMLAGHVVVTEAALSELMGQER